MTHRYRRTLSSYYYEYMFRGLAAVGGLFPLAKPHRHGVRRIRDVRYLSASSHALHTLDVLVPEGEASGPRPVVLFVHGGSFIMLSKNSHTALAMQFAKAGCVVFNLNYRLAPTHPFPQPLEDVCAAWQFVLDHVHEYGGDPNHVVVTGESAGGNLITALTLATVWQRPEPFAREVFERGVTPVATMPFCPMYSVSRPERFIERKPHLPRALHKKIMAAANYYLQGADHGDALHLADPLRALEHDAEFERPLPPFYLMVGTADPILDDTRRAAELLAQRQAPCDVRFYPRGVHGFHGFLWQEQAQQAWGDALEFLRQTLAARGVELTPAKPRRVRR